MDKQAWEKPTVMPLGSVASGRGVNDGDHQCTHGTSVTHLCGNGSGAQVQQCKNGNQPPSQSCASGNGASTSS